MEAISIKEVLAATGGKLLCGCENEEICNISTNSREIKKGSLFVPIVGERHDGHKFIDSALQNGATAVICIDSSFCNGEKNWILVNDTKKGLQNLAAYYRSKFDIPIIGVTGSVGKTTTKEITAAALSAKKKVLKTEGNYNSQIGVPITVFGIEKSDDIAVIEMGMSYPGEMERLAEIVKPTHAIVTNIGISHIENLKTQENIMKEKLHIKDYVDGKGIVYLNGDDELLWREKGNINERVKSFGLSKRNDIYAAEIINKGTYTEFSVEIGGKIEWFRINTIGEHNILNAVAGIGLAKDLGIEIDDIREGLLQFKPIDKRQVIEELENGIIIIDDSYNASPDSITSGLSVLNMIEAEGKKIAVLADMLELGEYSEEAHYKLGKTAIEMGIRNIITIGKHAKEIAHGAKDADKECKTESFDNNEETIEYLKGVLKKGDVVLVKGSRSMKTDEIVKGLKAEL